MKKQALTPSSATVRTQGFTIVELLIIILIVVILAALGIVAWNTLYKDTATKTSDAQSSTSTQDTEKDKNTTEAPKLFTRTGSMSRGFSFNYPATWSEATPEELASPPVATLKSADGTFIKVYAPQGSSDDDSINLKYETLQKDTSVSSLTRSNKVVGCPTIEYQQDGAQYTFFYCNAVNQSYPEQWGIVLIPATSGAATLSSEDQTARDLVVSTWKWL